MEQGVTNLDESTKVGLAGLTAIFSYVSNTINFLFWILVILACFDFGTGFIASWVNGESNSRVGKEGAARKIGVFTMVIIAIFLDMIAEHYGVGTSGFLYVAVTSWYIALEILSNIENLGKVGLDIPPILIRGIKILKNEGENKKNK